MSALVDRALADAGLLDVEQAREQGDLERVRAATERLLRADLLVLGALADRIRSREVGDVVRVFAPGQAPGADVVVVAPGNEGLAFLRAVAVARITGRKAARVRVDFGAVGLELAQVALGFGASELSGALASKRGLPIAAGQMSGGGKKSTQVPMQLLKQKELAGFIERSGRRAVFAAEELEIHA